MCRLLDLDTAATQGLRCSTNTIVASEVITLFIEDAESKLAYTSLLI